VADDGIRDLPQQLIDRCDLDAVALEGEVPGQHLVSHHAKGVEVDPVIVGTPEPTWLKKHMGE
jgi:hypothetical protein